MAIIKQKDNRSGITYAYEAIYRWDKEKKQSRCKRTLIGRVDKVTGEIVPTDGRCKNRKNKTTASLTVKIPPKNQENFEKAHAPHLYYGATYLLDAIGEKTGVIQDLETCFPKTYK